VRTKVILNASREVLQHEIFDQIEKGFTIYTGGIRAMIGGRNNMSMTP
jgi:hypothetical protein